MNIILLLGSVLGLLSVIIGAYIDHSLAIRLNEHELRSILTAVHYHQIYALIIITIGFSAPLQIRAKTRGIVSMAGYLFVVGTLLFSFSIYFATILGYAWAIHAAPMGGITLMIGWCFLMAAAKGLLPSAI